MQRLGMERLSLRKLNDEAVQEQYQVKTSIRFVVLKNLDDGDDVDTHRTSEIIKENIKASATESLHYYELKQHKPWFDKECSSQQQISVCFHEHSRP